jgi:cytochrome c2
MTRLRLYAAMAAVLTGAVLAGLLMWNRKLHERSRSSAFLTGNPQHGSELFFGAKRCATCHAVNGEGSHTAPDLGQGDSRASLSQLVVAMWNHAPHMLEKLQADKVPVPHMSHGDMADILAFLYTERACDEQGDPGAGAQVFAAKKCARCHAAKQSGEGLDPQMPFAAVNTPILWAEISWNHAGWMEMATREQTIEWPRFQGREMADLFAWARQSFGTNARENPLFPASPERGARLFAEKSCVTCHAVNGRGGTTGPPLGREHASQIGLVGFAGAMFNHSPALWRKAAYRGIARPGLTSRDVADLAAFLYSLGYFEPRGTAVSGALVFAQRGCSGCHGLSAEGTSQGPRLRGLSERFNTVRLAATLWQHGPGMLQRTKDLKVPWPTISESDVGDLMAFLNSAPEHDR